MGLEVGFGNGLKLGKGIGIGVKVGSKVGMVDMVGAREGTLASAQQRGRYVATTRSLSQVG